jgi:CelD/BcsL family acetyltransferase involved in cellulose biosynthesis
MRLASTDEELQRGLASFAQLHYGRWDRKGGSGVLHQGVEDMLEEVSRAWVKDLRFRLWTIEHDGEVVSAQIFLAAGGQLVHWLGGFDDEWGRVQPAILSILAAIEHAFSVGDDRLDLGGGGQPYKYRFADSEQLLASTFLVLRRSRYPLVRARSLPIQLRHAVAARLTPETKNRLHGLRHAVLSALKASWMTKET